MGAGRPTTMCSVSTAMPLQSLAFPFRQDLCEPVVKSATGKRLYGEFRFANETVRPIVEGSTPRAFDNCEPFLAAGRTCASMCLLLPMLKHKSSGHIGGVTAFAAVLQKILDKFDKEGAGYMLPHRCVAVATETVKAAAASEVEPPPQGQAAPPSAAAPVNKRRRRS